MIGFEEITGYITVTFREGAPEDEMFDAILTLYYNLGESEYCGEDLTWTFDGTIPELYGIVKELDYRMDNMNDVIESISWSSTMAGPDDDEATIVTMEYSDQELSFTVKSSVSEPIEAFLPAHELVKQLVFTRPDLYAEIESRGD